MAREIEAICPDAWLIQSGNPVYDGCTVIGRETDVKVCGLCHGYYGYRDICDMLDLDHTKVKWQAPGLNHNIWLTQFEYEGKDAYPLIDEWIQSKGEAYWAETAASRPLPPGRSGWSGELRRAWEIDLSRAAVHMYRLYGLMPLGDTVWMKYIGWWYHKDFDAKRSGSASPGAASDRTCPGRCTWTIRIREWSRSPASHRIRQQVWWTIWARIGRLSSRCRLSMLW